MSTTAPLVHKRNLKEIAMIITAILASVAISGGIIAIFAHNWDDFPFAVRLIFAFLPIIFGVLCFSYAFLKHPESKVWMEASTVFLMLMTGSTIGLVAQVYNMGGTFERFLLTWMVLTIPMIYIGRSVATAILYLLGITWWLILLFYTHMFSYWIREGSSGSENEKFLWWILFMAFIPFLLMHVKRGNNSLSSVVLGWFAVVILLCGGFSLTGHFLLNYLGIIMLIYGFGKYYYTDEKYFWSRPFQTMALPAIILLCVLFSAKGAFVQYAMWVEGYKTGLFGDLSRSSDKYLNIFPLLLTLTGAIFYNLRNYQINKDINYFAYAFPLVMIIGIVLGMAEEQGTIARWMMNLFLLGYGCYYLYQGMERGLPGIVVTGVVILCITLTIRYFDMRMAFWLKGIIYLAVGSLALWFNMYYSNKIAEEKKQNNLI
jgi:uncharacterized membrane protein